MVSGLQRAQTKHVEQAGEEALATSLISPKSGPRTGITEISSPSSSLPVSFLSVQQSPPPTCTQSLVVLGDNATMPFFRRRKEPSLGSWFLVPGLKTVVDMSQMRQLAGQTSKGWPQRHAMSRRLLSTPAPGHKERVNFQLLLQLQPHSQPRSS